MSLQLIRTTSFANAAATLPSDPAPLGANWEIVEVFGGTQFFNISNPGGSAGKVVQSTGYGFSVYANRTASDEIFEGEKEAVVRGVWPASGAFRQQLDLDWQNVPGGGGFYQTWAFIFSGGFQQGIVYGPAGQVDLTIASGGRAINFGEAYAMKFYALPKSGNLYDIRVRVYGAADELIFDASASNVSRGGIPVGKFGFASSDQGDISYPHGNFNVTSFEVYGPATDTTGPSLALVDVGRDGELIHFSLGDISLPVSPSTGATGLIVEQRADNASSWVLVPTGAATRVANDTYKTRVTAGKVRWGYQVRARLSNTTNIVDAQGNAALTGVNVDAVNESVIGSGTNNKGEQVLGTRGIASVGFTPGTADKEAINCERIEMPYGARSGFKLAYTGLQGNDGDGNPHTANINISDAYVMVTKFWTPTVPEFYHVTFNSGSATAAVAPETVQESDPINVAIGFFDLVHVVQTVSSPAGLPGRSFDYAKWGGTALDRQDTYEYGDLDTLVSHYGTVMAAQTVLSENNPQLSNAGPSYRGYGPMCVVGRPSSQMDDAAPSPCVLFLGDSINLKEIDPGSFDGNSATYDPFGARGWNGRIARDLIPYVVYGKGGSGAGTFLGQIGNAICVYLMGDENGVGRKLTHAHDEYGVNSLRQVTYSPVTTGAVYLRSLRQAVYDAVVARGFLYSQQTLTFFSDDWIEWVSQGDKDIVHAQRLAFNADILANFGTFGPASIGCSDCGAIGFPPAVGPDRLHPPSPGHYAIAQQGILDLFPLWFSHPNPVADISDAPSVATPTFTPVPGSYSAVQSVVISCATNGATIHYTTNGTPPDETSPVYSAAVSVGEGNTNLQAIGIKAGMPDSAIASAAYVVTLPTTVATPTFDPVAGSYEGTQTVAIACATPGAVIHYTTNGSTPTAASPVYSGPVSVAASKTLKAIAILAGSLDSAVASAAYVISQPTSDDGRQTVSILPITGDVDFTYAVLSSRLLSALSTERVRVLITAKTSSGRALDATMYTVQMAISRTAVPDQWFTAQWEEDGSSVLLIGPDAPAGPALTRGRYYWKIQIADAPENTVHDLPSLTVL